VQGPALVSSDGMLPSADKFDFEAPHNPEPVSKCRATIEHATALIAQEDF